MAIEVTVLRETMLHELTERLPEFEFLTGRRVPRVESRHWYQEQNPFGGMFAAFGVPDAATPIPSDIFIHACIFIGKTGYGKSTTLNALCGHELFETNAVTSCTKELFCIAYDLSNRPKNALQKTAAPRDMFAFGDLPGVGESVIADQGYIEWYREFIASSDCVVYVLRADQRDFSIDQQTIAAVLPHQKQNLLIGLNYCDAVEPLSRSRPFMPSQAQITNIERKCEEITRIFGIPREQIIPYSATEQWQLDVLVSKIAERIRKTIDA